MRVIVLGCGSSAGVPQIGGADGRGDWGRCDPGEARNRRTRASIVIERDGRRLLIDTSPDLRLQLIDNAIPSIEAILFTHAHADHVTGLDDVRILNRIAGRPLEAFGTDATLEELGRRFDYAFRPWKPPGFYAPVLEGRRVAPGETIAACGMDLRLIDQDHGYVHTLGVRIDGFAYSTDLVDMGEEGFSVLAGVDTWLLGCFQRAEHRTHANLGRILDWVTRIRPRRTVLTHMGPDMDWSWLKANLPPHVEPAHDGQVLEIPG